MSDGLRTKTIEQSIRKNVMIGDTRIVVYEPGDCTRYDLVFTPVGSALPGTTNAMLVTVSNFRHGPSMLVEINHGFLAPWYLSEKMGIEGPSAVTLAEVIAHFTERTAMSPEDYRRRQNASAKVAEGRTQAQ